MKFLTAKFFNTISLDHLFGYIVRPPALNFRMVPSPACVARRWNHSIKPSVRAGAPGRYPEDAVASDARSGSWPKGARLSVRMNRPLKKLRTELGESAKQREQDLPPVASQGSGSTLGVLTSCRAWAAALFPGSRGPRSSLREYSWPVRNPASVPGRPPGRRLRKGRRTCTGSGHR